MEEELFLSIDLGSVKVFLNMLWRCSRNKKSRNNSIFDANLLYSVLSFPEFLSRASSSIKYRSRCFCCRGKLCADNVVLSLFFFSS